MKAKPDWLRWFCACGAAILLAVLAVGEARSLAEAAGSRHVRSRNNRGAFSSSAKRETPYEMMLRTRRQGGTRKQQTPEPLSVGPVVAEARLKTVPATGHNPARYLAFQRRDTTLVRPPDLRDLPADVPAQALYVSVPVGDRDVPAIVYRSTRGWRHAKLRLDTDGDGLLSDETEYVGTRLGWFRVQTVYAFGPVSVPPAEKGARPKAAFHVQCTDGQWLTFSPAFYREGRVTLDGRRYKIATIDRDFDGKYNELFTPPAAGGRAPGCDVFAIDLDGNAKFDFGDAGESEIMPLSRLVKVNGDYYNASVSEDGSTVEFRRATPGFGTLDFGGEQVKLRLWSDAEHLHLTGPGSKWRVPAGKYGVVSLELTERDSAGNRWVFRSSRSTVTAGELAAFEVLPGETTSFRIGPPFQVRASLDRRGGKAWVDFELEGRAGELYKPGGDKNTTPIPEPTFRIVDGTASVVDSGRFKYG
ncbi:MAG: hypothetical protein JSU70_19565 [Phycisphaerales bacterium]|nr:MAG: hypothetical protein JSU70_19565 [Phycisphaerales bacterium]